MRSIAVVLISLIVLGIDGVPIHDSLIGCYRGNETQPLFPNSLSLLIELVRKIEDATANSMNIRMLSAVLLHTLRVDGIEREPTVHESELVTPYGADGISAPKFQLLLKMISNTTNTFDVRSVLTAPEMCQLHRMLSATVDPWERGDENILCPLHNQKRNSVARRHHSIRPIDGSRFSYAVNQRRFSRCPTEGGVVRSFDYGTFTVGTVIASIAAGLQPQNVPMNRLLSMEYKRTPWDRLESMRRRDTAKELRKLLQSLDAIDNGYAAGLAGDLAEICVYQGPYLNPNITIGVTGHWNDSYLPRIRYLDHIHNFPRWEMTDSELLAGIDGLFLAQKIMIWTNNSMRLRLSQVLDMYYSNRGLPFLSIENSNIDRSTMSTQSTTSDATVTDLFNTETNRKFHMPFAIPQMHESMDHFSTQDGITSACSRRHILNTIDRAKLKDETYFLSQVLQFSTSSVAIPDHVLRLNCNAAVDTFFNYSMDLLMQQPSCNQIAKTALQRPVVDLTLITDGSRDHFSTLQLISFVAEAIEISKFGSHLSVINGITGNSIVNRTQNIADTFQMLRNFTANESRNVQLSRSLGTFLEQLSIQTRNERSNGIVVAQPQVLLIMSQGQRMAEIDFANTRRLLHRATIQFPDLYLVFITNSERFVDELMYGTQSYGQQQNSQYFVIREDSIDIDRFGKTLVKLLQPLPQRIIASACQTERNQPSAIQHYHEGYVSPNDDLVYRISPYYLIGTGNVRLQFDGVDYGTFTVCMARNRDFIDANCQTVSGYETISFYLMESCTLDSNCDAVFFRITVDNSLVKCLEHRCRYPDQVRFNIREEGLRCSHSSASTMAIPTFLFSFSIIFLIVLTNK